MHKRTRTLSCLGLLVVTAFALTPFVGTAAAQSTYCEGGDDDALARRLVISTLTDSELYFSFTDNTLWEDVNGIPGIQRTARTCSVLDDNHRVVSTYVEFTGDERIA